MDCQNDKLIYGKECKRRLMRQWNCSCQWDDFVLVLHEFIKNTSNGASCTAVKREPSREKKCQLIKHLLSLPIYIHTLYASQSLVNWKLQKVSFISIIWNLEGMKCFTVICCAVLMRFDSIAKRFISTHTTLFYSWRFAINLMWISLSFVSQIFSLLQIMEKLSKPWMLSRQIRVKK